MKKKKKRETERERQLMVQSVQSKTHYKCEKKKKTERTHDTV